MIISRCPMERSAKHCKLALNHATEYASKAHIAELPQHNDSHSAAIHYRASGELLHDVWFARGGHQTNLELLKESAEHFRKSGLHYMKIGDYPSALKMFRNSSEMAEHHILLYESPKAKKDRMYELHIEVAETLADLAIAQKACNFPFEDNFEKIKQYLGKAAEYSEKPMESKIDKLAAKQLELEHKIKEWKNSVQ
ncbi:MAG: hypothetical protein V1672_02820 [Candidatus Diapherotrites archaeon]